MGCLSDSIIQPLIVPHGGNADHDGRPTEQTPFFNNLSDERQHQIFAKKVEETETKSLEHKTTGSTSFFKTCFNGLNALSGVGILSTPYALATGGWLSFLLFFAIAMSAFYSGLLIQRCMESDPNIRVYPDIGESAFGKKGRALISVFMYVELFLVATGFLILEGDNLHNLIPGMEFEIQGFISEKQSLVLIVALVILPTVWVDNLSILSYVSASGVLASAIILFSILWTGAFNGIGFHSKGKVIQWSGIPTAVSLYGFCYCAHPVFPTIYNSMKKKHQFSSVLIVCFTLCTICYASMAVMGYLMFGDAVESQITLNLPIEKLSSRIAIYTTLVNPICKYALMVTPLISAIKKRFSCSDSHFFSIVLGTIVVISTAIVAICVPLFGSLMSLVGAFLSITASIILPCSCYLKISGHYRRLSCESVAIWFVIGMGLVITVSGTYTSVLEIYGRLLPRGV